MDFKVLNDADRPFAFSISEQNDITDRILSGDVSIIKGGILEQFEQEASSIFGNQFGVALTNGSSAIFLALKACGVASDTEVILPTFGFHGAAVTICALGAKPVFCDIDPDTLTIDIEDATSLITSKTKAILVLHPWGNIADIDQLLRIKEEFGVALVSDSSHCHGGAWGGKKLGTFFDVNAASFGMNKLISGGELGLLSTDNSKIRDAAVLEAHVNRIKNGLINSAPDSITNATGIKMRPHAISLEIALNNMKRFPNYLSTMKENYHTFVSNRIPQFPIEPVAQFPKADRSLWKPIFFHNVDSPSWEDFVSVLNSCGYSLENNNYMQALHQNPIFTKYYGIDSGNKSFPGFEKTKSKLIHLPHELFLDGNSLTKLLKVSKV